MPTDYDNRDYRSIPVQVRDEKIPKIPVPVPVPNRNTDEEKHDGIDVGSLDKFMRNTNAPRPASHTGSAFSIGSNQGNRTSFNDNLMNINRNLEAEFNKSFIETENFNRNFIQPRSSISNFPQEFGTDNASNLENLSELGFNENEEFGILGKEVTPTIRKVNVNPLVKEYSREGIKYLRELYKEYKPVIPAKEVAKMFPANKKKELIDILIDLKNEPHIVGKTKGNEKPNLTSIEPFLKRTPYKREDIISTDKTSTEATTRKSPSKASTKLLRAIKESNNEEEEIYTFTT
jgi:hypothetical protein